MAPSIMSTTALSATAETRTRIKVCGITRPSDALAAISLGVDALGMIFYANSPRYVNLEQAKKIREVVPAFVSLIGVFVDAKDTMVQDYSRELQLDSLQLHGNETADYASRLNRPYIKALRVKSAQQVKEQALAHPNAQALLLDPYVDGVHGGTGQLLDSESWPDDGVVQSLILAGGLSPSNIGERVSALRPYAVDINSGVETAPGEKSADLMRRAVHAVKQVDQQRLGNIEA